MSQPLSAEQFARLCELIEALADERITPEECAELEAWVCGNKEARRIYVQYMNLCASIHWDKTQEPAVEPAPREARVPLLGFLADVFRSGTDLLGRPFVLGLLWAVGLPGILVLILVLSIARQPAPEGAVAALTRTYECVWGENSARAWPGADVFVDQRLELRKGLAEITFARGAKVLLEGPATFTVAGQGRGFLHDGSLVATVEKEAEGFTIQTPALAVVDLGTEFGVRVEDAKGTGEIEVFRGKVELQATAKSNPENMLRQSLTVGQAAHVEMIAGPAALPTIRPIAATSSKFVRRIPAGAIVADFSGGAGNNKPSEYPGAAGAGWASGWTYRGPEGMPLSAAVERASPLLGGGDYLRVLVEQPPGAAGERCGIDRCMRLTDAVDLTKPHVVVFSVRIDALGWFDKTPSQLVFCSLSKTQPEVKSAKSGWHIRLDAKDYPQVKAGHWSFLSGDGEGGYERVDSGVAAREGEIYSFRILVDPAARTWTPSMAVGGGSWKSFEPMGMRSIGTAQERGYWPYFYVYWLLQGVTQGANVERLGFSVDSIRITAAGGAREK